MWNRKELKASGKNALHLNYWKTVLVAFLLSVLVMSSGGFTPGFGAVRAGSGSGGSASAAENVSELPDAESVFEAAQSEDTDAIASVIDSAEEHIPAEVAVVLGIGIAVILLIIVAVAIAAEVLLINPLEVGCARFSIGNLHRPARIGELGYAFDHSYKNVIKTEFFRDLYLIGWSLLLVIPGIVKMYEYRMIPYILAEHPEMERKEVFAASRDMMRGQKWKAFVLDLSFIGWEILSAMTLGILKIFYVGPYRMMTNAALYEALAYGPRAVSTPVGGEDSEHFLPENMVE